MKRPSFQFYPDDWQGNKNIKRSSHEQKGIWLDVMCLMHDNEEEYGLLRWTLKEIALAINTTPQKLKPLVDKGILKGADPEQRCKAYIYVPRTGRKDGDPVELVADQPGPIWYSSRMVRDEYVRKHRGESTRFSSDAQTPPAATERAKLRQRVLAKSGGKCHHCSCDLGHDWEIDRLLPISKQGTSAFSNLVASCRPCNQAKSDTSPDDWRSPSQAPTRRHGDDLSDGSPSPSPSPSSLKKEVSNKQHHNNNREAASDFQLVHEFGSQIFPKLFTANTSEIHKWLKAECDIELDIKPVIKRFEGRNIGSWNYFSSAIMDAKASRERPLPQGTAKGRVDVDQHVDEQRKRLLGEI